MNASVMRNPNVISEADADQQKRDLLKPWLIKGFQAEYEPAVYPGKNTSGLIPFGPNVLVKMDASSNVSSGGIIMVDERVDRMNEASITGVVFEVGPMAFRHDENAPTPGDRVYIEKYAGIKAIGMDGELYRLIDEKQIGAKVTETFRAVIEGES